MLRFLRHEQTHFYDIATLDGRKIFGSADGNFEVLERILLLLARTRGNLQKIKLVLTLLSFGEYRYSTKYCERPIVATVTQLSIWQLGAVFPPPGSSTSTPAGPRTKAARAAN